MRRSALLSLAALALLSQSVHGETPRELLARAVSAWGRDVDAWSFVQHVREYRGDTVHEERTERFDPSRPDDRRWELLTINQRTPSEPERHAFDARKNSKPRRRVAEPLRLVDLERVMVVGETPDAITFEVPLRSDLSVLVPFERIATRVEVDRSTATLRSIDVTLREEMKIAFGLAKVTQLSLQFRWENLPGPDQPSEAPGGLAPVGMASATLTKLGRRAEISWSDFARVRP